MTQGPPHYILAVKQLIVWILGLDPKYRIFVSPPVGRCQTIGIGLINSPDIGHTDPNIRLYTEEINFWTEEINFWTKEIT